MQNTNLKLKKAFLKILLVLCVFAFGLSLKAESGWGAFLFVVLFLFIVADLWTTGHPGRAISVTATLYDDEEDNGDDDDEEGNKYEVVPFRQYVDDVPVEEPTISVDIASDAFSIALDEFHRKHNPADWARAQAAKASKAQETE